VVSLPRQIWYLTKQDFQLRLQGRVAVGSRFFNTLILALPIGSLFYWTDRTSVGTFKVGGTLFFNTVLIGWMQMYGAIDMTVGRSITFKHTTFVFYRPAALVLVKSLVDMPILVARRSLYTVILYFMESLEADAGKFFLNLLFVFVSFFPPPPHQTAGGRAGVMITVYYRHRLPNSIQPCRRRLQQRAKRRHPNCLPRPARHDLLHGLPAARGEHEVPGVQVDILGAATNLLPRSANGKSTRRRIHQMLRNRPNPRHPIRKHHKQRFSLPPIKSQGTSDRVLTHDFSSLAHGGCQTRHRIRLGHRLPPRILGPLTCKMRGVTLAQWWPSQSAT